MELLSVFVAALASYAFGSVWYMTLAKTWVASSGVPVDADGQPANRKDPLPYITAFAATLVVAGMMRHTFATSGIDTIGAGAVAGLGVGLFFVTPWIATFYTFSGRPRVLLLIDGVYATVGCALIGTVLMLF